MAMNISGSSTIYETIASYFRKMIDAGALRPGQSLPSVREVALAERVNPNTVARAFSLLQEQGYVTSVPKKGYFVCEVEPKGNPLRQALSELLGLGYTKEDIEKELRNMEEDK